MQAMLNPLIRLTLPALLACLLLPAAQTWAQAAEVAPTASPAAPLAASPTTSTAPSRAAPVPESCRNAGADGGVADCVERLARVEERRLDAAVEKLSTELRREPRRRQLVRSQRLWREYRDAQCDYMTLSVRSGAAPNRLAGAQCLLAETTRRNDEIAHMVPPAARNAGRGE